MRSLRPGEKVELAVAALVVLVLLVAARGLSREVPLGPLIAYAAAVVLGQGLVRDLVRVAWRRARPRPTERAACLCAESSVGLTLVAVGLGLTVLGDPRPVLVTGPRLTVGVALLLAFGFVAKDWVVVLRRVEDHGSIAVGPPR